MKNAPYGTQYTYDELDQLADSSIKTNRYIIARTDTELKANDQRTLVNDWGHGYHIANPNEHIVQAQKRQRRARRQILRAQTTIQATNLSKLTKEEKAKLESYGMRLAALEQQTRLNSRDIARNDREFKGVSASLQEQIDKLTQQVEQIRATEQAQAS